MRWNHKTKQICCGFSFRYLQRNKIDAISQQINVELESGVARHLNLSWVVNYTADCAHVTMKEKHSWVGEVDIPNWDVAGSSPISTSIWPWYQWSCLSLHWCKNGWMYFKRCYRPIWRPITIINVEKYLTLKEAMVNKWHFYVSN